jgi:CDP-diacylglycerol--serine O-phosphatidyltransferase
MVLALSLVAHYQPGSFLIGWLESGWFIPIYSLAVSTLMVSPLRLYSLKMKGFTWKKSRFSYLLVLICLPLVILLGLTGIFFCIPAYMAYTAILAIIRIDRAP